MFGFEVDGSNITVLPGVARIGNTLMQFNGAATTFGDLASFGSGTGYQNVLVYLRDQGGAVDMTKSVTAPVASVRELLLPNMTDNSGFPLGLLTFNKANAVISLPSYYSI